MIVTLGSTIRDANETGILRFEIEVYNTIFFPNENERLSDDIALIRLPTNVTFTKTIQAAILPKINPVYPLFHDEEASVMGWSNTTLQPLDVVSNSLSVNIIKNTKCELNMRTMYEEIFDQNICVEIFIIMLEYRARPVLEVLVAL